MIQTSAYLNYVGETVPDVTVRVCQDLDAVRELLYWMNYEIGVDTAVIFAQSGNIDTLWFAYCTDPDGEWFVESRNPTESMEGDGYLRAGLKYLPANGPYLVMRAGLK